MNQATPSVIRSSTGLRQMPINIGTFHFVGIGGIGMSGIAEILHNLGYQVQGSDNSSGPNVQRLREKGIKIFEGHDPLNVKKADVLVVSTAIRDDNPEVQTARKLALPIVRRAEMLGELMCYRHGIAVADGDGVVVLYGLKIYSYAQWRTDFIVSSVAFTDVTGVFVKNTTNTQTHQIVFN